MVYCIHVLNPNSAEAKKLKEDLKASTIFVHPVLHYFYVRSSADWMSMISKVGAVGTVSKMNEAYVTC